MSNILRIMLIAVGLWVGFRYFTTETITVIKTIEVEIVKEVEVIKEVIEYREKIADCDITDDIIVCNIIDAK